VVRATSNPLYRKVAGAKSRIWRVARLQTRPENPFEPSYACREPLVLITGFRNASDRSK